MILGDSLQVMASLAEREGLSGKVQCIYIDPPYRPRRCSGQPSPFSPTRPTGVVGIGASSPRRNSTAGGVRRSTALFAQRLFEQADRFQVLGGAPGDEPGAAAAPARSTAAARRPVSRNSRSSRRSEGWAGRGRSTARRRGPGCGSALQQRMALGGDDAGEDAGEAFARGAGRRDRRRRSAGRCRPGGASVGPRRRERRAGSARCRARARGECPARCGDARSCCRAEIQGLSAVQRKAGCGSRGHRGCVGCENHTPKGVPIALPDRSNRRAMKAVVQSAFSPSGA